MNGNPASEKLLLKCGFTRDALLRDWMYWDGKHFDMIMYSKLCSDSNLILDY
jgi:ribosomal-protein-alanine N-acetyltransferase